MTRRRRVSALGALALACLIAAGIAAAQVRSSGGTRTLAASPGCQLQSAGGDIKHVIYLIFDNTHFLRDKPNVPSDLEQMPHLLNFMRNNGTFLTNNHTILISHTAGGIVTSFTGLYPDRHGQAVSNSYRYFKSDGSTDSSSSFKYWTDLVDDVNIPPTDPTPNMVTGDSGTPKNTPAPWVPYTRAGCDFGAVASANIVLENTRTGPNGDMTKVFGPTSTERAEAITSNAAASGTALRNKAQTDYIGLAIHCGAGGGICAGNPKARPDLLPEEPGGYDNYLGLFGAKYVNPVLTGGSAVFSDLDGHAVTDQFDQNGFPGFDGLFASTTLSYIAAMQEHGIPVTFGYISDAHDDHGLHGEKHISYGPGQAGYVAQLKHYDDAFATFFDRLANHGINKSNTLFVFTVDEGDHFVGSQPTPAGCNGVSTPCSYSTIGENNVFLPQLLKEQKSNTTPFTIHSDMAPNVYVTGNLGRTDAVVRKLEHDMGSLTAVSPYTGSTDNLLVAMADPVGEKALHMVTADPQRTPTFTYFGHPDYFFTTPSPFAPPVTDCNPQTKCVFVPSPSNFTFAWNHGSIDPEIATTWLGLVGPGVRRLGDDATWADHTDVRPTMLTLVGLGDSYVHDGRVLIDQLDASAVPQTLRAHRETLRRLGEVYKQLNAPFGTFGMNMLTASTRALKSDSRGDGTYTRIETQIDVLTSLRDPLASRIKAALDGAAFGARALNEVQAKAWIREAEVLLARASALATGP